MTKEFGLRKSKIIARHGTIYYLEKSHCFTQRECTIRSRAEPQIPLKSHFGGGSRKCTTAHTSLKCNLVNFEIPNEYTYVLWKWFWDLKIYKLTFQTCVYTSLQNEILVGSVAQPCDAYVLDLLVHCFGKRNRRIFQKPFSSISKIYFISRGSIENSWRKIKRTWN